MDSEGKRKSFQTLKRTSRMVPWLAKQGIVLPADCFTPKGYLRWARIPVDIKRSMREHARQEGTKLAVVSVRRGRYVLLLGKVRRETRKLNLAFTEPALHYPRRQSI